MSSPIYILSAKRTPVGSFQGAFTDVPAVELGATAIKGALEAAGAKTSDVDEVVFGQVLSAGSGQAPARQAALKAGLQNSTPCMTINKVCGSGLKTIMLASDSIALGNADLVVAGGQENMTQAPYLMKNARAGFRMGHQETIDSMIHDGLWDPYNNFHMGVAAEMCAAEYKMTRKEQDEFAKESYQRAQKAQSDGLFKNEIVAVEVKTRKGSVTVDTDEEPGKVKFDKIPTLRPAFEKTGTVTAANASSINDGAAAVVVASEGKVKELGAKPMAKIVAHATFAHEPKWFTTAPVGAMKKALEKAGLKPGDIDLWEINEAFSNVTMAAMKDLEIPREKVNVNGGSVAIGHPIGASGARIFTTLLHSLIHFKKKYGMASLCIGGGEAVAVIVENENL